MTDEIRNCWYELSQGVLDIVVKLFVLAQFRAIVSKQERITVRIMESVYEQDLKPVHPMLDALRSRDPERIAKYSDLRTVDIEKRLLELGGMIVSNEQKDDLEVFGGHQEALRVYNLMRQLDDYDLDLLVPLVKRIFEETPDLKIVEMLPVLTEWYSDQLKSSKKQQASRVTKISRSEWCSLESDDLRYIFSEFNDSGMHQALDQRGLLFNLEDWAMGA